MYFNIIKDLDKQQTILIFDIIINHILWDYSTKKIPFSNLYYYNYQTIALLILDYYELQIRVQDSKISIIIKGNIDNHIISQIINSYIDSKFSNFN